MPEEEKVYTSMYSRNAELYHHQILGAKWGIMNGPPYPLDSSISTGKRLKKIFSRDKGGKEVKKTKEKKDQIAREKTLKKENKKMLKESKRDTVTSKAVKKAKGMTDEELKKAVARLNFEKQYANLEKDLAELNKKNPTLGQKVKESIKKNLKEQINKTGKTIVNTITSEMNKQISNVIKENMSEIINNKTKIKSDSNNKEKSKISKAFDEYKKDYKEGWKF